MAKKKDDSFLLLIQATIIAVFSVFLINTIIVNRHFAKKYDVKEKGVRVSDSGNILRFGIDFAAFSGGVFLLFLCAGPFLAKDVPIAIRLIALAIVLTPMVVAALALSARIGATQIGMLIFRDKDMFVIPTDPNKNTFVENVLKGGLLTSMFTMEELPLSGLNKITKQSGKKAFLHGTFGTRRVVWRNKQKRDECIAALEFARGKRLSSFDSGE